MGLAWALGPETRSAQTQLNSFAEIIIFVCFGRGRCAYRVLYFLAGQSELCGLPVFALEIPGNRFEFTSSV